MTERNDNRIFGDLSNNPTENPEPHPAPEANPQPQTIEERLEQARIEYYIAKQKRRDAANFLSLRGRLKKEERVRVEKEYEDADAKYNDVCAEYIGTDLEKFLQEREALIEAELVDWDKDNKTPDIIKRVYNGYKQLGEYNLLEQGAKLLGKDYKAKGRIAKMVNARTAISLGLLGIGVGLGAGTAVGAGAIAAKRGFSGMSSAFGSYDLANVIREKLDHRNIEEKLKNGLSADEAEKLLFKMRTKAALDGKTLEQLKKDDLFYTLQATYENLIQDEASEKIDLENFYSEKLVDTENKLNDVIISERLKRLATAAGSTIFGVLVGSGELARWFGHKTGLVSTHEDAAKPSAGHDINLETPQPVKVPDMKPEIVQPEIKPPTETLPQPIDKVTDAPEIKEPKMPPETLKEAMQSSGEAIVHAGSRGLEGALLDLKDSNPQQYSKMIEWLKTQDYNKGVTNEGSLVHRFMLNYAENHEGMSVDQGGKDLSRIFSGEMHVGSDGEISIGDKNLEFMPEKAIHAEPVEPSGPSTPAEVPQTPANKNFDYTFEENPPAKAPKLDYSFDHPSEVPDTAASGVSETAMQTEAARELATDRVERASDAIQLVLDHETKGFLKDSFKLSPTTLNRIAKKSIAQFLSDYESGNEEFKKTYKGLFDSFSNEVKSVRSKMTIRQYVLTAALEFKKSLTH